MPPRPATSRLGKYRIDGTIGKGAMGVVYRGYDEDIERPVALKMLHSHLLGDDMGEELAVRFRQEAKAAARCMHTNIVAVFDYGIYGGEHYIVMEYVEGSDLKSLLRGKSRMELPQAVRIVSQVLSALEYAHGNGVVHRDIKPGNVLLMHDGRVKVTDFGIARLESSELTQTGFMLGTPNYMSPEALRGQADARSDLYAVGVMLYEMLTGNRLGPGGQIGATALAAELAEAIADPTIAGQVQELLLKALHADPASRYQNAGSFSRHLAMIPSHPAVNPAGTEEPAPTVVRPAPDPARSAGAPRGRQSTNRAAAGLSPTAIVQLEKALVSYLGPMASRLVKKHTAQCEDIDELIDALAAHIPAPDEQTRFRTSVTATELNQLSQIRDHRQAGTGMGTAADSSPRVSLSQPELERITAVLAPHLGPLASRILARAQRDALDWPDLCHKLANIVRSPAEKQALLSRLEEIRA